VSNVATELGRCLIIDCHSFPSVALPYELDQREERADFCIGCRGCRAIAAASAGLA
jgi:hypothetical protein